MPNCNFFLQELTNWVICERQIVIFKVKYFMIPLKLLHRQATRLRASDGRFLWRRKKDNQCHTSKQSRKVTFSQRKKVPCRSKRRSFLGEFRCILCKRHRFFALRNNKFRIYCHTVAHTSFFDVEITIMIIAKDCYRNAR